MNNCGFKENKMGVDIGVRKNLIKVSDDFENPDYDFLDENYDNWIVLNEEDEMIAPFTRGVYTCECGENHTQFSYGGNCDFLDKLNEIGNETGIPFTVTLDSAGIDNYISYLVAEKMLKEFEQNLNEAMKYFEKIDNFYAKRYNTYIKILKECIECKGLVKYS